MPPTLGLSIFRMNSLDVVLLKTSLKPGSHSAAEVTCRVLCYDGSTLLVTSRGDAMAQWADAVEGNAFHLQILGKCLKPNGRASETGVVGLWEIDFDESFLMTSTVLASPYYVRFYFKTPPEPPKLVVFRVPKKVSKLTDRAFRRVEFRMSFSFCRCHRRHHHP